MPADTNNGRITLAVLKNEMEHVRRDIADLRKDLKYLSTQIVQIANDQLARITELEKRDIARDERWSAHKDEHAREVRMQRAFSGILATTESVLAALVGILVQKP